MYTFNKQCSQFSIPFYCTAHSIFILSNPLNELRTSIVMNKTKLEAKKSQYGTSKSITFQEIIGQLKTFELIIDKKTTLHIYV